MKSLAEIHQLLAMGVITVNEARDLAIGGPYRLWPDHLRPEIWEPEVIERAQRLRDERDGVVD